MTLIIVLSFLMFLFYYLACFNTLKLDHQWLFILFFIVFAGIVRYLINPELNKDYDGYFYFRSYESPENIIPFFLSEPYINLIYNFFSFFVSDKAALFKCMYWFNFLITNVFFIWLATRKDLFIWKKMVLFVFYYFLFGFVLLRNAPVYILYACFFYYSFRGLTFKKVLFTPFMHLSALPFIVLLFQKNKHYIQLFVLFIVFIVPIITFLILPNLTSIVPAKDTISKVDTYAKAVKNVAVFHKIHVVFMTLLILFSLWYYKKKAINPIFITTFSLYFLAFLVNPVLGFRFSPYVFFAILFFNLNNHYDPKIEKYLSLGSFILYPYFLSTLYSTHNF